MSAKYYTLLTDVGAAKLASATALGIPLKITQMAVGDGGGSLPTPNAKQTALAAEKRRAALNMLYIDPQNTSQIIAEQVIPETEGGWWIREVGLFDETGALIAVGNCPESYKPQLAEGSGRTQTVRMVLITSSTDNITLKVDPSVVLATRKYVDDKALELRVYVDDQLAKHIAAPDPHTQYARKDSPVLTGTPTAPTPPPGDSSKKMATTEFVAVALAALAGSAPQTLDTLKELADALGNDPNFAATVLQKLGEKLAKNQNGADIPDKAAFLLNLGLGEAAKRGVASNDDMQTGTAENLLTSVANIISLFPGKSLAENDFVRIPDRPGGVIIQWGKVAIPPTSSTDFTLRAAFPTAGVVVIPTALDSTTTTNYRVSAGNPPFPSLSKVKLTNTWSSNPVSTFYVAIGY